jgi:hypothetical protein
MLPSFGLTLKSMVDIVPVLAQYITVLAASMYFFAIIGMTANGGLNGLICPVTGLLDEWLRCGFLNPRFGRSGMESFANVLSEDNELVKQSSYGAIGTYWDLNFNSMVRVSTCTHSPPPFVRA